MRNETNETIEDIVAEMRGPYYKMGRSNASLDKDMSDVLRLQQKGSEVKDGER